MRDKTQKVADMSRKIASIVVFRGVRDGEVLAALRRLLEGSRRVSERVEHYSDFVSALYKRSFCFSDYLLDALAEDENDYVKYRARGEAVPPVLGRCVERELLVFQELSELTYMDLREFTGFSGELAEYETRKTDMASEYEKRLSAIHSTGYGIYARHVMFRVENGDIIPVRSPDPIRVESLVGYTEPRRKLIENTQALVSGLPAANTLLVGDAGTGKSSTVKAVANLYAPRGVRLVELKKEQLRDIPQICERLRDNPLKFILFIDDLSFQKNDDNFSALKATLEGSASVRADNTVIYATSNRRHLVKETFTDRDGDDVHRNDTMQELLSLSERFGLTILYTRPAKEQYLEIVHGICCRKGIPVSEKLDVEAEAFALRKGGMSPRAAEQFTDSVLARQTDRHSKGGQVH